VPDGAKAVVGMACRLLDRARGTLLRDGQPLRVCIGIATDRVVAGVIGSDVLMYHVTGDAVSEAQVLACKRDVGVFVAESTINHLPPDLVPSGFEWHGRLNMVTFAAAMMSHDRHVAQVLRNSRHSRNRVAGHYVHDEEVGGLGARGGGGK
jgi:class 3 adenylate cyclase